MTNEKIRIQKLLAQAGYGSRRQIEQMIRDGRIEVAGHIAELGEKISVATKVKLDGRLLKLSKEPLETRVILYHKPVGEICSHDDALERGSVYDSLPKLKRGRWVSVGRLDVNTSGLLLFTNNGDLANKLMHPSQQVEREYAVRIFGTVDEEMLTRLTHGVALEDGQARFEHIVDSGGEGANHWYHVVVVEGRNRLVRRLWESQGVKVSRLQRVRFGPVILERAHLQGKNYEVKGKLLNKLLEIVEGN